MSSKLLSVERLKSLLSYDPETGIFIWRDGVSNKVSGKRAGTLARGYIVIGIDGKHYMAHRLAWLYSYGCWPSNTIDHKNRIRDDNSLRNLRDVTSSGNSFNQNRFGISGVKGVRKGRFGKWRAAIQFNGKQIIFGSFSSIEKAKEAYDAGIKNLETIAVAQAQKRLVKGCLGNIQARGVSGSIGVVRDKKKWVAQAYLGGKTVRFGSFDTIQEATEAYESGLPTITEKYLEQYGTAPTFAVRTTTAQPRRKPTHPELLTLLHYDPLTGIFRERVRDKILGKILGSEADDGYIRIQIWKMRYYAHRLAIFYMNGCWPDLLVDHINGIRSDNRFSNLREVTAQENCMNRRSRDQTSQTCASTSA